MSEFNITVEGGKSVRLKTAGKYCDRDIVVTATGTSHQIYKTRLEYLESTDRQYIDTGYIPSNKTELEIIASGISQSSFALASGTWFFGARTGYLNNAFGSYYNPTEKKFYYAFGSDMRSASYTTLYESTKTIQAKATGLYVDGKQIIPLSANNFTAPVPLTLFALNTNGSVSSYTSYKIHCCKIWDGGVLVRDFIPVLDWNDRPCMYDKVTDELFYNQGTGEFLYGEPIVDEVPETGLQEKTVTPTKSVQEVVADSGYEGLSKVTVEAIPDEYIVPSGELEITENGEYDVAECAKVNVNVPSGGGGDAWIENGGTTYTNDRVVKIGAYVFQGNTQLASVSFPNALSVGTNAFNNCKVLATVYLPEVTSIGGSAFYQSPKVADFYAPKVTTLGNNVLRGNALTKVIFPELTSLGTYGFTSCTKLEHADLGSVSSLGTYTFNGCTALTTLILRRSSGVTSLAHATNVFASTPIANGTGYVYILAELVERHKVATNWSTYAAQIRPLVATFADLASIDGSVYDRAWVDDEYCVYIYDGSTWAKEA